MVSEAAVDTGAQGLDTGVQGLDQDMHEKCALCHGQAAEGPTAAAACTHPQQHGQQEMEEDFFGEGAFENVSLITPRPSPLAPHLPHT